MQKKQTNEEVQLIWDILFAEKSESEVEVPFSRMMRTDDRKLPYRERDIESGKILRWDDRRKIIEELEFLSSYAQNSNTILYTSCDTDRYMLLANLFPKHKFIIYSTRRQQGVKIPDNVDLHVEEISKDLLFYVKDKVLFISYESMPTQMEMHINLKPYISLLKFKLPYTSGSTNYLKGMIYYPVWGSPFTSECRLICQGTKTMEYDHTDFEEKMYRFNRCTRVQNFNVEVDEKIPITYDIASELYILKKYITKVQKKEETEINGYVNGLKVVLAKYLNKNLEDMYHEHSEKLIKKKESKIKAKKRGTSGRGGGRGGSRGRGGDRGNSRGRGGDRGDSRGRGGPRDDSRGRSDDRSGRDGSRDDSRGRNDDRSNGGYNRDDQRGRNDGRGGRDGLRDDSRGRSDSKGGRGYDRDDSRGRSGGYDRTDGGRGDYNRDSRGGGPRGRSQGGGRGGRGGSYGEDRRSSRGGRGRGNY